MAFTQHLWGKGWLWASIAVLVALFGGMGYVARPYYLARGASNQADGEVASHLSRARPLVAVWIGGIGLVLLIWLMVFKPF